MKTALMILILIPLVTIVLGATIQDRLKWGFWPWQYTPEKMKRKVKELRGED